MKALALGPGGHSFTIDDELLMPYRRALCEGEPKAPARLVFAAAHVVMKPEYRELSHSTELPGSSDEIATYVDWKTTMALRAHLDAQGFGIAEAMDTAQRFSLGWASARRLIEECGGLRLQHGFIAGAGVDHLEGVQSKNELIDGVVYQARLIQGAGGMVTFLPLVWLAQNHTEENGYVEVYGEIIRQLEGPLFVHWLGDMFLPGLTGYFPGNSFASVMALDPEKVRGCKLSLLDEDLELRVRRELLERDQIVLTGDDLHFARLIHGSGSNVPEIQRQTTGRSAAVPEIQRYTTIAGRKVALGDFSHALLGILDGIAVPAGLALKHLARGDGARYMEIMEPCEALGRHVFSEPTAHYKTGLAFLSWLNGLQENFMLVNHEERCRDVEHLLRTAELAAAAGALRDTALAAERLKALCS